MSIPADIVIRPVARREEPVFGVRTPGDTEHGTLEDVAAAANPLHYIPFVSQVYESATGNHGSAAMKIIGGAIIGGPIGFLAGLASAIFEQENGQTIVASIAEAITGTESATQVASATATQAPKHLASVSVSAPVQEILPPELPVAASQKIADAAAQDQALAAKMQMANAMGALANPLSKQDQNVLALFGSDQKSAHSSYRQAQMLPYLKDVSTSLVM